MGGPTTAPLISEDATGNLAADGTVQNPCPTPRGLGGSQIRTANNRPPVTTVDNLHVPDIQDSQGDMAQNVTTPGGAMATEISPSDTGGGFGPPTVKKNHGTGNDNHARSDDREGDVSFEETTSDTTLNIGEVAVQQPPTDDGLGRQRPAFWDLEQGGEVQTQWTIASHIFGE